MQQGTGGSRLSESGCQREEASNSSSPLNVCSYIHSTVAELPPLAWYFPSLFVYEYTLHEPQHTTCARRQPKPLNSPCPEQLACLLACLQCQPSPSRLARKAPTRRNRYGSVTLFRTSSVPSGASSQRHFEKHHGRTDARAIKYLNFFSNYLLWRLYFSCGRLLSHCSSKKPPRHYPLVAVTTYLSRYRDAGWHRIRSCKGL